MKNIIKTLCGLAIVGSASAQTSVALIDDDFSSGVLELSGNSRVRTGQTDGTFYTDNSPQTNWMIVDGVLSNAGATLDSQTEGAISQVVSTSDLASDLTSLTLSFDYEVGANATLKFALIGYTENLRLDDQDPNEDILLNNGTSNGNIQNNTNGDETHGDMNLLTGEDMAQSITDDLIFQAGTSGSHSITIDLTSYSWGADEAVDAVPGNSPGLSGSITSIADFDLIVLVAVNDLESEVGSTVTTLDNINLVAEVPTPSLTLTWDGATDANWSANTNWDPDIVPISLDSLIFSGTSNTLTNNDLAEGTEFRGIAFNNTLEDENFTLSGNSLVLGGDIALPSASGSITDTIALDLELNGVRTVDTGANRNLIVSGVVSEDGSVRGLVKTGLGTLTLPGENLYTGNTVVGANIPSLDGGTLSIQDSNSLGSGSLVFENDGTLELGASELTVANGISVFNRDGTLRTLRLDLPGNAVGTLTGEIDIRFNEVNGFAVDVGADDSLMLNGLIRTGAGGGAGITKIGDGTLFINNINNTYLGNTTVSSGTLILGDGEFDTQLNDNFDVIVETGATLNLNFETVDTIRSLFIGGVEVAPGNYTASDFPEIVGTGSLEVIGVVPATVPNIISLELNGTGQVVLTLDGSEQGLTVQRSDDLSADSFVDVDSIPGANTLTIDAANVDLDANGADFYRIRN